MAKNGQLLARIDERVLAMHTEVISLKSDIIEIKDTLTKGSSKISWLKTQTKFLWSSLAILGAGLWYVIVRLLKS